MRYSSIILINWIFEYSGCDARSSGTSWLELCGQGLTIIQALGQIEHHSFSMDMHIQFPNEGEINDRHMFVGIWSWWSTNTHSSAFNGSGDGKREQLEGHYSEKHFILQGLFRNNKVSSLRFTQRDSSQWQYWEDWYVARALANKQVQAFVSPPCWHASLKAKVSVSLVLSVQDMLFVEKFCVQVKTIPSTFWQSPY